MKVDSWSVDGLPLTPQSLSADTEPGMGGKGEPVGLLGNDVLSRFGAVRIDFDPGALVLPGPEGAPLSTSMFTGPKGPDPTELTKGQGVVVPAEATTGPVNDYLNVSISFGRSSRRTGSSWTQGRRARCWTRGSAKRGPSAATNLADRSDTVCSVLTLANRAERFVVHVRLGTSAANAGLRERR